MATTCITSLPTEILTAIARELRPRDLERFFLTCRDILVASTSVLKEHRILQKRYKHISTGLDACEPAPSEVYHHFPTLVKTVLQEPKIAAHVEQLSLVQQWGESWNFDDFDDDLSLLDVLDGLNVSRSGKRGWHNGDYESEEQLAGGLLLQHLPNLELFHWCPARNAFQLSIVLQSRLRPPSDLIRARLSDLERNLKIETPQAALNPPLLPALKKVIIDVPEGWSQSLGLIHVHDFIPFLALPSIESLHITSFDASMVNNRNPIIALVPHRTSNLRELVLSRSSLGEGLDHLLRLPRSLHRLTFVAPISPLDWASHEIFPLDRLRLHELERLTIRMREWHHHIDRQALPRIYRRLLYLETNVFLTDDATLSPVSEIKHYFPSAVQHVVFADSHFETQMDICLYFQQILGLRRAGILPDLRRLTLRSERGRLHGFEAQVQTIEQGCLALGVEFEVDSDWECSKPEPPVDESPGDEFNYSEPVCWWARSHEGYSTREVDLIEGHGQPRPQPQNYHYCNQEL